MFKVGYSRALPLFLIKIKKLFRTNLTSKLVGQQLKNIAYGTKNVPHEN